MTPSLRARLVDAWLRRRVKALPLADMEPAEIRRRLDMPDPPFVPRDVRIETVAAPLPGEWHRPPGPAATTILYLHGGGYVFGTPTVYRPLTCRLARETPAEVFSLAYRLAPEHPCPAAIDDAEAAWNWLCERRAPDTIAVAGDSAGGGLTLALLQRLRDAGAPGPAGAVLISPWTDLAATGASVEENDRADAMFRADTIRRAGARYAVALALDDPRVSPLYGRFEGLPPMLVFVSDSEVLRDDGLRVAERASAAGVAVDLVREPGLPHIWPLFAPLMPEAAAAIARTVDFARVQTRS